MFLFFSVARSAQTSQAERANQAKGDLTNTSSVTEIELSTETGEKMPTDKLLDVSAQALRMSSPFNSAYWLTAA